MASRDEVMAALAGVPGPDGRTPLPESGAISGLTLRDGKVFLAIVVDPDRAKAMEPMRARAEAAIKATPGVTSAVVTLTAESARADRRRCGRPGHATRTAGGQQRQRRPRRPLDRAHPRRQAHHRGRVRQGRRRQVDGRLQSRRRPRQARPQGRRARRRPVRPLDAEDCSASRPSPTWRPDGHKLAPLEAYGVKVMSIGFLIEEGAPVIWRGPMVMSALTQLLREVDWGDLDVLVVDMPPGTGDTQLTMAQNVPLSGAVIVSTPQDLALIDARRGIAMFKQVHVPLIGVVENMSYFLCPHCGGRTDVFSHAGAQREAEKLGVPFLGEVPLDIAIRANSDDGRPIVASLPDSGHAGAFLEIARRVAQTLEVGAPGAKPAPRIRIV